MGLLEDIQERLSSGDWSSDELVDEWGPGIFETLDEPEIYLKKIRSVPPKILNFVGASYLYHQVVNGGYWQYFHNSYGTMVNQAINGLLEMGFSDLANVSQDARDAMGIPFPMDTIVRQKLLGETPNALIDLDPFNDRFFGLNDFDSDCIKMDEYALTIRHLKKRRWWQFGSGLAS